MKTMKEKYSDKKASFVENIDELKKVNDITELKNLINQCRENKEPLTNLNLSGVELKNIDMSVLDIVNVVFNTYNVENSDYKEIYNVSFKGSKLTKVCFAQCSFERCNFDKYKPTQKELEKQNKNIDTLVDIDTIIHEADFFMTRWESSRFRNTKIDIADFRYSEFKNCSMGGCHIMLGDFYMAAFLGTTDFTGSTFKHCSITNAIFENDLIRVKGIDKLVQECYDDYSNVIIGHKKWFKQNPCGDFSYKNEGEDEGRIVKSKIYTHDEASVVYAQLSGLYASKGFFKDSNLAYERAKCNEAYSKLYEVIYECSKLADKLSEKIKKIFTKNTTEQENKKKVDPVNLGKIGKNIFSLINIGVSWILGFGYKLKNVLFCIVFLVLGYALIYHTKLKTPYEMKWYNELACSLNNTIGPYEDFYRVVGLWLSSIQTTLGILLVGFAGFVLANRVRNNY